MPLDGILDYGWDTTIYEMEKEFQKRNFKEITIETPMQVIENGLISAKTDYHGLPVIISVYYNKNGQIYAGTIELENLDNLEKSDFHDIEEKLSEILINKYGIYQFGIKEEYKVLEKTVYARHWSFKNNCSIIFSSSYPYTERTNLDSNIVIGFNKDRRTK
jgi:hypothetical protein